MKKSWFQHTQLTTEQADELEARYRAKQIAGFQFVSLLSGDELEARYRAKQIKTERSLDNDFIHWTISAFLPEASKPPRQDRTWQQRIWR